MKLTIEQASAITSLINNPDFLIYMNMVSDKAEESLMALIKSPDNLERNQGRCQAYTEIIEATESAKETLRQYQNSK